MTNYGPNEILDLNTSFERSLSKLSKMLTLDNGTNSPGTFGLDNRTSLTLLPDAEVPGRMRIEMQWREALGRMRIET